MYQLAQLLAEARVGDPLSAAETAAAQGERRPPTAGSIPSRRRYRRSSQLTVRRG
jgi:hypothetical protein